MSIAEALGIPQHLIHKINGRDVISIDGMRSVAQNSGAYAGQSPVQWTADGKEWVDVWLADTHPAAARVSVYRSDWPEPMTVVHTMREYAQGKQLRGVAASMPAHMLAKATEALALRKAFPQHLGGIYSTDEMAQADAADDKPADKTAADKPADKPKPKPVAKPAAAPTGTLTKAEEYATRKDELVKVGKKLRADMGNDAAKEFALALNERGCDFDKLTAGDMVFIKSQAEVIAKQAEAATADQNEELDAGVQNAINEFDGEIII